MAMKSHSVGAGTMTERDRKKLVATLVETARGGQRERAQKATPAVLAAMGVRSVTMPSGGPEKDMSDG